MRLEMSEAAAIQLRPGAFQRTPMIQAIVLNKNRLTRVRADMFQGLGELYSLDLQGNRLEAVEPRGFANLAALRHLDISYNLLQSLPMDTFDGTFEPSTDDRRVIYACENPWLCDSQLEWFRQLLLTTWTLTLISPAVWPPAGPAWNGPARGDAPTGARLLPVPGGHSAADAIGGHRTFAGRVDHPRCHYDGVADQHLSDGFAPLWDESSTEENGKSKKLRTNSALCRQQVQPPPTQLPSAGFSSTLPRRNYATIAGGYGTGGVSFGSLH
ncbi:hypothetical protein niasHT_039105 [Heterodera trifolii]|uniref:Uncharacterized protein n=1 Tax=Heterodera trifolii TaxID=157864 RepID=A0ABD2IJC6_9BILA